ncbi:MAG: AAA family ATPase, partial [Verrucomicrobiota bacterium]
VFVVTVLIGAKTAPAPSSVTAASAAMVVNAGEPGNVSVAPSRPTRARFVQKLAQRYLSAASLSVGEKELAIEAFLKGNSAIESLAGGEQKKRRCIIIDNVQRVLRPGLGNERQEVFSYLHELQEETGCCIILTWVPTFRRVITGADPFWQQFLGRIGGEDEILRME